MTKYKVVINPCEPACQGCAFNTYKRCNKPRHIKLSCVVKSNYGLHMGIIVVDKGEDNADS